MNKFRSILLIEDDDVTNFYNEHVLKRAGVSDIFYKALNGKEALDILSGSKIPPDFVFPELILMDLHMPIMDGWEFLEHYHQLPGEQQVKNLVIMLTNPLMGDQKAKAEGFPLITGYLNKPLQITEMTKLLFN
ncbi:MAG: response regulator [Bacteroidia bacterium]|nr:response regulator [Bacteroidia bacterium]